MCIFFCVGSRVFSGKKAEFFSGVDRKKVIDFSIMDIIFKKAKMEDFAAITFFVDFWLSGRGRGSGKEGVANDYFVSHKQHMDYLKRYHVLIARADDEIIGWAVKNHHNVLIHVLIAGDYRGKGIGTEMIRRLEPEVIRSKMDQSTGDPGDFYRRLGYFRIPGERVGRKKNIEFFTKLPF